MLLARLTARRYKATMRVEQRLIWILGSPRSGSTWLMTMLLDLLDAQGVNEPLIGAHLAVPVSPVVGQPLPNDPTLAELRGDNLSYFFAKSKAHVWRPPLRRLLLEERATEADRNQNVGADRTQDPIAAQIAGLP